jgi:hypothetical protein
VLIYGANEPNMIMLDLQSGSNFRHESLSQFWKNFPEKATIFGHPRTWEIVDSNDRLRLASKHELASILYAKLKNIDVFITSPFDDSTYEQGSASDMLMQLIQDYFIRFGDVFSEHSLASKYQAMNIAIIPAGLLKYPQFLKLKNLHPGESDWKIDIGYIGKGFVGLRVVYSEDVVFEKFGKVQANDVEQKLFKDILEKINSFVSDDSVTKQLLDELSKHEGKLPRFTLSKVEKPVSFPEFVDPLIPSNYEHKLARKRIAQLSLLEGINPGKYDLKEAHKILNDLRKIVIAEINKQVSLYPYKEALLFAISACDAVVYDYERTRIGITNSLKHDVDFSRKKAYAKMHSEFVHNHKSNRYLIEKFIELKPEGTDYFDPDKLKYLLSLVDKLMEISEASDNIHYGLYQVGLTINRDFVVTVEYKRDVESMSDEFGEYDAEVTLGLIGNDSDKVKSDYDPEDLLSQLDDAFLSDFEFSIKDLVNTLQVFSHWPGFARGVEENTTYSATLEEIDSVLHEAIDEFRSDTQTMLEFLTLNNKNLHEIIDSKEADDIPVWEHEKRPNRYTIRPLILFEDKYYWGPCSADKAGHVWMNVSSTGFLPYQRNAPNVKRVLGSNQVSIQNNLEKKAIEIAERYTKFAERVNYSRGTHPQEIGEYDALIYLEDKNLLLNVECKDVVGAYCLKDAKTIRDKIFREETENGRKVRNPGNLIIVEKRAGYLKENVRDFAEKLKWPIKDDAEVISVYLTRYNYWWTYYPPRNTQVKFMRIELFDTYLKELLGE